MALVLAEGGAFVSDTNLIKPKNIQDYFSGFSKVYGVAQSQGIEKAKAAWLTIYPIKTASENPLSKELIKTMINDYSGWHWMNRDPQMSNSNESTEILSRVKTLTLIITGDLTHAVLKEVVSVQKNYIPLNKTVVLKNSNHMLNLENPDQFYQELKIFSEENNIK